MRDTNMNKEQYEKNLQHSIIDFLANSSHSINDAVKIAFETIMKAEQDEFLNYAWNKRNEKNGKEIDNKRNGYRQQLVAGINGAFRVKIPRDRLGEFKPVFLDLIKEEQSNLQNLAFSLYAKGLSTRDIESVMKDIYQERYGRSSISRITANFQEYRIDWQQRQLEENYLLLYVDALQINVRRDRVAKECFYIVLGLKEDLSRDILGVWTFPEESAQGWQQVFEDIKERGVQRVLSVVADGLKGLKEAVHASYPNSDFQRCQVHKMRNIGTLVRVTDRKAILADYKEVLALEQPDNSIDKAKERLKEFLGNWDKKYPRLTTLFETDVEDNFTFLNYPTKLHRMMYTTNWSENLNRQIRKTIKIRGSFPTENSALNLVCACLMDCETNLNNYRITSLLDIKGKLDIMMKNRYDML